VFIITIIIIIIIIIIIYSVLFCIPFLYIVFVIYTQRLTLRVLSSTTRVCRFIYLILLVFSL